MAAEGAHVFATDINQETLNDLSDEAKGLGTLEVFELNVLNNESVEKGIDKSEPDILFNCAGFVHNGTILEASTEDWDSAWGSKCIFNVQNYSSSFTRHVKSGALDPS